MLENDINRQGGDKVYKSVFLHEFWHAAGLDHDKAHEKEGNLSTPIMSPSTLGKDYLSIPELASIFSWLNDEKYQEAQNNGTLQDVCNRDFVNYLSLIKYGLQNSEYFTSAGMTSSTDLEEKQVFQLQYDETPDDGVDYKTTITFNYPFKDFCEKSTTKGDGSVEKTISPFIFVKKDVINSKFIILNSDCKHVENITLQYGKNIGTSLYKSGLSYDEVMKELKTMDPKNGYTVNADAMREKHFEYETQNLWQQMINTTQKNDIMISEQLYKIFYNYNWKIGDFTAEETTNSIDKNMLKNQNIISYVGENYEKN